MKQHEQFDDHAQHPDYDEKSKSQVKREFLSLQDLGKTLIGLSEKQLEKIPLDERVRDQVVSGQSMQRGALKRQIQYIGKLLRSAELAPIHKALAILENQDAERNAHFHRLERLRDQLLDNNPQALNKLLAEFPNTDRQQLHQLIRNAQKEKELGKAPASSKQLFRFIRELYEQSSDE